MQEILKKIQIELKERYFRLRKKNYLNLISDIFTIDIN